MIAVTTCATKRYAYSLPNYGRRIATAVSHHPEGVLIFVGDESKEIEMASRRYVEDVLPEGWEFILIKLPLEDEGLRNYKEAAQMLIAQMQSTAFSEARRLQVDACWSVESDVLVPPNGLRVSEDMLRFDDGYYDVAMVSYPSQGGGAFLGGRGSHIRHIEEDVATEERELTDDLKEKIEVRKKESTDEKFSPSKDWLEQGRKLDEEIKKCAPKGNVFSLNAEKWRKRGWMEYAYPAIGKGAVVPTDWVGFGCTLMSKKALSLAHFDGYEGKGTQDLHVCWNYWNPNGINMAVITHVLCDHIVRSRDGDDQKWDKFVHINAYHEPSGDAAGHLRQRHRPFYKIIAGEKFDESNDGMVATEEKKEKKQKKPSPKKP